MKITFPDDLINKISYINQADIQYISTFLTGFSKNICII